MALFAGLSVPYTEVMIRVLILEEHVQVRQALEANFRDSLSLAVVKSTGQYAQALQHIEAFQPDVVLMECKAVEGLETLKAVRRAAPWLPVIVLTSYLDSFEEEQVLSLGAAAYVLKTLDTHSLIEQIQLCARSAVPAT